MHKKITSIISALFFLIFAGQVYAFKPETFVTFTNPVRGPEGWTSNLVQPLDLPQFFYKEATFSAFPVTWSLRYDAVSDATISSYIKHLSEIDRSQSIGAFLEITPNLAKASQVNYPDGISQFDANRIFLSGYSISDRKRLIDVYMETFFNKFGFYPRTVMAWHLDSYSLAYLQSKYSVLAAINCDDQYSMDHYRLWGGYLGSPYFPDKNNSLVPADSLDNRINLAMVRWAQRDLFNFYGRFNESLYSVQTNDYLKLNLPANYFENLLGIYSQKNFNEFTYLNVGLENDDTLFADRKELARVLNTLRLNQDKYSIRFISLADFGDWFKARYPESSPAYFYSTTDPAQKNSGTVYWYQSPYYRVGLKSVKGRTQIFDLRVYNRQIYEEYFATPNQDKNLFSEIPAVIDSVKYPEKVINLDIDLSSFSSTYSKQWDMWQMSYSKGNQKLIFGPDSITLTNIKFPEISATDIKVKHHGADTIITMSPQAPSLNKRSLTPLMWILLTLGIIYIIYHRRKKGPRGIPLYLLIATFFVVISGFTVFTSGLSRTFGVGFSGPNGHDAIFHLSLIEKFARNPFDFSHPQISGQKLANYHFVFDYVSGLIVRTLGISSLSYYFLIFPLLCGFLLVHFSNRLLSGWHFSSGEKLVTYFFLFFGGSLGFIPKILTSQDIFAGESSFWSNQSVSIFLNPPYALSILGLFVFFYLFQKFSQKGRFSLHEFLILCLIGGLLAQVKVYAFILLTGALFFSREFKISFGIAFFGLIFSLPFSSLSGSPFVFSPLWFPRSLFASYDRFYWPTFVSAWQAYEASGVFLKLIAVNAFALTVFIVGNLGVRLIGFLRFLYSRPINKTESIIRYIVLLGLIIPCLFTQKINPWNTIQFMYYSLLFLSPFVARVLSDSLGKIPAVAKFLVYLVVLSLGSFTTVGTLRDYWGYFTASRLSYTEIAALNTLRSQSPGLVISPAFNPSSKDLYAPKPLYNYVSSAYISAFSNHDEYLSDTINLDITGYDYQQKIKNQQRFYNTHDRKWAKDFLDSNNIKYVYETPLQKLTINPEDIQLSKIFDSGEINLYKYH